MQSHTESNRVIPKSNRVKECRYECSCPSVCLWVTLWDIEELAPKTPTFLVMASENLTLIDAPRENSPIFLSSAKLAWKYCIPYNKGISKCKCKWHTWFQPMRRQHDTWLRDTVGCGLDVAEQKEGNVRLILLAAQPNLLPNYFSPVSPPLGNFLSQVLLLIKGFFL